MTKEERIIEKHMNALLEEFTLTHNTQYEQQISLECGQYLVEGYAVVKGEETFVRKYFKTWKAAINYIDRINFTYQ